MKHSFMLSICSRVKSRNSNSIGEKSIKDQLSAPCRVENISLSSGGSIGGGAYPIGGTPVSDVDAFQ